MASDDEPAIGWTAEVQGDKTVVAQHPDGHRIVFSFSADGRNEVQIRNEQWAAEGDHAADLRAAAVAARVVARAKGWLF